MELSPVIQIDKIVLKLDLCFGDQKRDSQLHLRVNHGIPCARLLRNCGVAISSRVKLDLVAQGVNELVAHKLCDLFLALAVVFSMASHYLDCDEASFVGIIGTENEQILPVRTD